MSTSPTAHLGDLLPDLLRVDPGRPRVTWYVVDGSDADGERVELSGAVLANWAAKAANLLQDELDVGPGSTVLLDLPPHWRSLYWAVASWAVGATVVGPAQATVCDVVITTDPGAAPPAAATVVVTLAALARSAEVEVPPGAVDEARELATFGDAVVPYGRAEGTATALTQPAVTFAGSDHAPERVGGRRLDLVHAQEPLGPWLAGAADVLRTGGSLVLVRCAQDGGGVADRRVSAIAAQERVDGADGRST